MTKQRIILFCATAAIPLLAIAHMFSGLVDVEFAHLNAALFDYNDQEVAQVVLREIRIPRVITAILAGGALSLAGLFMQTLFQNPLAGPYVLGINSGASLFVAIATMSGITWFSFEYGMVINAMLGAFVFGIIILLFSRIAKSQITLLLTGIMLGSFTSAFIAILQQMSELQDLKRFTLWGLGSLQKVTFEDLPVIAILVITGLTIGLFLIRSLNVLVLGTHEAQRLGISAGKLKYALIGITAILAGVITAYCGPIAFVGLAVPNVVRIVFRTQNHRILIPATVLFGSLFLLICDFLIVLLEPWLLIPINALTSIFGAPIVVLILFRKLK